MVQNLSQQKWPLEAGPFRTIPPSSIVCRSSCFLIALGLRLCAWISPLQCMCLLPSAAHLDHDLHLCCCPGTRFGPGSECGISAPDHRVQDPIVSACHALHPHRLWPASVRREKLVTGYGKSSSVDRQHAGLSGLESPSFLRLLTPRPEGQ